ncbi:MAG TPA: HAMP domain-containing sensor histidine kinase [Chitinophagaceae bacterium]|jgi:two-component system phosphate regulon sensor histidine kinase PhoR
MAKRRFIPDPALMAVTILVVTGFQVYWLKDSYDREIRSLQIKTNVAFQAAVRELQTAKLKIRYPFGEKFDNVKMTVRTETRKPMEEMRLGPEPELVTIVNAMNTRIRDSQLTPGDRRRLLVSMKKDSMMESDESLPGKITTEEFVTHRVDTSNRIFQFLYAVDSLQDSLHVHDIENGLQKRLSGDNVKVPFTVVRLPQPEEEDHRNDSNVTIGFAHPVTYHLSLGSTLPYLLRRLSLPILFSIFLVGVTVFSFFLLYRNLVRQRRLAEIKDEFIGNITHELKTPIATVSVAIEALRNFSALQDPARTREYLDISANELQRLGLLVDKVLKLSMFEKQEIDFKFELVDLAEVTEEVITSMRLQIEKHHASVELDKRGDTTMTGDRLHLLSVVFNLVDNALKYGTDEPVIRVRLSDEGDQLLMEVKDNGIGIPPEYREKVFEKFFRVPTGNRHNAKGYGLGLSYVAQVVAKHGGTISISGPGEGGTDISIIFPRQQS